MNAGPTLLGHTARGLIGYVHAVAAALGVPESGTNCELADTTTAYLALTRRCAQYPDRDLMLAWGAGTGWVLAVETGPEEPPCVLSYYGPTLVPAPEQVATFVDTVLTGAQPGQPEPPELTHLEPDTLDRRLKPYQPAEHAPQG